MQVLVFAVCLWGVGGVGAVPTQLKTRVFERYLEKCPPKDRIALKGEVNHIADRLEQFGAAVEDGTAVAACWLEGSIPKYIEPSLALFEMIEHCKCTEEQTAVWWSRVIKEWQKVGDVSKTEAFTDNGSRFGKSKARFLSYFSERIYDRQDPAYEKFDELPKFLADSLIALLAAENCSQEAAENRSQAAAENRSQAAGENRSQAVSENCSKAAAEKAPVQKTEAQKKAERAKKEAERRAKKKAFEKALRERGDEKVKNQRAEAEKAAAGMTISKFTVASDLTRYQFRKSSSSDEIYATFHVLRQPAFREIDSQKFERYLEKCPPKDGISFKGEVNHIADRLEQFGAEDEDGTAVATCWLEGSIPDRHAAEIGRPLFPQCATDSVSSDRSHCQHPVNHTSELKLFEYCVCEPRFPLPEFTSVGAHREIKEEEWSQYKPAGGAAYLIRDDEQNSIAVEGSAMAQLVAFFSDRAVYRDVREGHFERRELFEKLEHADDILPKYHPLFIGTWWPVVDYPTLISKIVLSVDGEDVKIDHRRTFYLLGGKLAHWWERRPWKSPTSCSRTWAEGLYKCLRFGKRQTKHPKKKPGRRSRRSRTRARGVKHLRSSVQKKRSWPRIGRAEKGVHRRIDRKGR